MRQLMPTVVHSTMSSTPTRCPLAASTILAGRYRIQGVLGQGGMATVYSAWDEALGRTVAVKACQLTLYGQVSQDEARLQAGCQHPNLMPLYDAGSDPLTNTSYIVMPFYPGADLGQMLNRHGPLPFRTALLCVDQVCSALDFLLQRRQAIHGDIKPANIWLTHSGAALLMDFNLYGLLARGRALRGGTPGFTAPEALAGGADTRSDVFSLGCVLYASLTGQPPFADDAAVVRGSYIPVQQLRREIYPELAAVVHRALETDVTRRYQTVREFQNDLRRPLQAIENQRFLPFLGQTLGRAIRSIVGRLYSSIWWLLRRQFRFALRRPIQALVEIILCVVIGRVLIIALIGWLQTHALLFTLAACGVFGALLLILACVWKLRRGRPLRRIM